MLARHAHLEIANFFVVFFDRFSLWFTDANERDFNCELGNFLIQMEFIQFISRRNCAIAFVNSTLETVQIHQQKIDDLFFSIRHGTVGCAKAKTECRANAQRNAAVAAHF